MNSHHWQQKAGHDARSQLSPDPVTHGHAPNSTYEAHRLFAAYPTASATPSTHVGRHMNHLSVSAPNPTYLQRTYLEYNSGSQYQPAPAPSPLSEYSHELSYLSTTSMPTGDSRYWHSTRDDSVRLLSEGGSFASSQFASPWLQSQPQSTYHPLPFAQSLIQRMNPPAAYPTPPPPGIRSTSSSLAFALGHPLTYPNQPKPPTEPVHRRKEPVAVFNHFIAQKNRDIEMKQAERDIKEDELQHSTQTPSQPVAPRSVQSQSNSHLIVQSAPRSPQIHVAPSAPTSTQLTPRSTAHLPVPLAPAENSVTPQKRKYTGEDKGSPLKRVHTVPSECQEELNIHSLQTSTPSSRTTPRQVMAYVEVPPLPSAWRTPSKKRPLSTSMSTPAYNFDASGSEEDDVRYKFGIHASVKLSARRTGDRDERAPLEKLSALIEDIFEAEDSLAVDIDVSELPKDFFSALTTDCSHPHLQANVIKKLTKHLSQLARPTKRSRRSARDSIDAPRARKALGDIDNTILARLLKILERSIKAGEALDPLCASAYVPHADKNASPRKPKKSPKAQRVVQQDRDTTGSALLNIPEEDTHESEVDSTDMPRELTEAHLHDLSKQLEVARDSILAVECCVALLSGEGLTKQLYSEELITACLSTVKNQLTMILFPFVEAASVGGSSSPQLQCIHSNTHTHSGDLRRLLSELFQAVSAVLPRINVLFSSENIVMSDAIIIQTVYIAIGPFFVVESGEGDVKSKKDNVVLNTLGNSAMRGLRLDALSVIRSIFANHEEQRSWIIEEILSSLIKLSNSHKKAGQFRLRDGRSIRTVSALLFQLVQTSAHDVRVAARKIAKRRQSRQALRRQDSVTNEKSAEPLMDELDAEEIQLYITGLESAMNAAKTIVVYLTQRSGKGKLTKNSNEAEYRTIFDNLISDLLVVLYWPEWPAASFLLSIVCKFMVSSLDDVKTSTQTDTNAAKSIALDHLGVIAARIRSSSLKVKVHDHDKHGLHSLDEVISSGDVKHLDMLISRHQSIFSHLYKRASEDQAYDSANDLTAATWGQELAVALKQLSSSAQEDDEGLQSKLYAKLKSALRDVWKDMSNDVFDVGSQEEINKVDRYAEEIGTIQTLRNSFGPILNVVLLALDAPAVFMRTKALRALGQIVNSDSSILAAPNVRRAIESHLLDSSPAVRDAAVELIGKYMIESPEVVGDYYTKIADRIADTGLGVRKRVIKLLKQCYSGTEDLSRRIDITTKLVLRMLDEDDTVKDLAIKTVEELWFQAASQSGVPKTRSVLSSGLGQDKGPLLSKVSVIMGVSANFKDRQSPLEDMLHKVISSQEAASASYLRGNYTEICEVLIDGLVDASDLPGFTVHNCVRTIYLFTTAYPSVLSGANASTLLPYLKNPSSSEELAVSDYLLKIFRISIPHMPKTAVKFGQELQLVLQPMIVKPSHIGGVVSLQESVACMCGAVQHLTHDFNRLVALVKSCNARLQQAIARPSSYQMTAVENRTLSILIFIVALLGEHCDFDRLRDDYPELNSVSPGPIVEHIYKSLLELYEKYNDVGLKGRILQCLGFLFRAQPTLMTLGRSASIMDDIFHSSDLESRGRLLRIMHDFLVSESMKHHEEQKGGTKGKQGGVVDMAELVGNTDGFADSGVSSAVVQRYISSILDAALSQHSQIQNVAVDILSFTIKQGLAHPLQSFPVIVALETCPNNAISSRANALHAILWSKHASLLNARYIISARQSFDYQKKISTDAVKGYRMQVEPAALLQRWYSLVREKRASRQDFLRALLKSFDINPSLKSSQDDVDFARYMAENFASLDYRTQEEVITVIKHLTSVLSTAGMQVIDLLSPSHLLAQLHDTRPLHNAPHQPPMSDFVTRSIDQETPNAPSSSAPSEMSHVDVAIMRSSITIGIVMLLKAHLKSLYGLSEEKCSKFVLGKKSAIGDKPAIRRHQLPITWTRLPYATTSLIHEHDLTVHRQMFIEVWNEDGVTAEPEDDDA
ncbi:uncharacterized protein F5891DRAFT_490571 [Suillus fuscotomentosus]|uniref:Sister chromatid cohesion protein n=1 Tax=Suillus fuscotomentosus TaxID=1912939 RepID=A0AAD4E474_9AGAM|nr:uncharacterized protein F5891DRAFT_490571 [Suillus fuscotomentosus]KAG1898204.1 hypothetical protein F5891DRAFT_490571 [Suillus fuscotomentosus]